jgi:hypothetical protein
MNNMLTLQQITERRRQFCLQMFILFTHYEKVYNDLTWKELWHREENIPTHFIKTPQSLYETKKFVPNAHPTRYNSKPVRTNKGKRDRCGLALTLLKK